MTLSLYNTRTKQKEAFDPIKKDKVGLYTCGPTVYNYAHIGNLRTYVFEDILRRVLKFNDYDVNHVMNITDVGHLTDDADSGEDKMEKGAAREGKTAWEIAEFYAEKFKENMTDLNITQPTTWCKATDHIQEQIDFVQALTDKGVTYETSDGIYFDTTKIDDYGKLANLENQELKAGERVDMGEKKNPHDFALWKWSPSRDGRHPERPAGSEGSRRQMEWDAFGHKGFPGWHIECSAMSMKYLGEQFDIHCGGIDHVPIHHTNEIAQTETLTGKKPWVNFWMHGEFLIMKDGDKMAKSADNFITLQTLKEKNIDPLAYRYFLLQTHYRKQLNFSWEALEAAEAGLKRLHGKVMELKDKKVGNSNSELRDNFAEKINDDLDTAGALALLQTAIKNNEINYDTVLTFDKVLGLGLNEIKGESKKVKVPKEVQELMDQRQQAREEKDFTKSDELRDKIKKLGFDVEDTSEGQKITNT
ncbi:cysteine--tRNA ligase [Candidatus Parcubacteria bacterium]|nr:MAG: cysteine--tRNA ligase [Candidatus Parcubacteria bacterium]